MSAGGGGGGKKACSSWIAFSSFILVPLMFAMYCGSGGASM